SSSTRSAGRSPTPPTRHRAVAIVQAPAEAVRRRTWALAGRVRPIDADTCTVDCSGDYLPGIAQTLAALDADYTLSADPEVLRHLRAAADRMVRATA
ncbi:DNA-binding transcriptional regulator, partial [Streptomyces sp. URMC 123]